MSATRRKGSRGDRVGSRSRSPQASNALTWAESLASGEPAPGPSALEWAEGLARTETAPSPWGDASAAIPPVTTPSPDSATTSVAPALARGDSPWESIPVPAVPDSASKRDANPWGSVTAAEPIEFRSRGKSGKTRKVGAFGKTALRGKKAKHDILDGADKDQGHTPVGGSPLPTDSEADGHPSASPQRTGSLSRLSAVVVGKVTTIRAMGVTRASSVARVARNGLTRPNTKQQQQIKRTLRRGLPRALNKPIALVLAGLASTVLGLGVGWGSNVIRTGSALPAVDAASCAQTQMAWTQAANAQSAMIEDQPETLRKGFINARNALDGVTPPRAIAEDWAIAFTYYSTVANNIEKVKSEDDDAVISAVGGAQQQLDTEAMVEASETISKYVNSNCHP